jgi:hypothetical protein
MDWVKAHKGLAAAFVAACLFLIWITGALDPQLAEIGLNKNECAEHLLSGRVLCGDDLRRFRAAFDTDEDDDSASRVEPEPEPEPVESEYRVGSTATDDRVAFTVTGIEEVASIEREFDSPVTPRPGAKLMLVEITYRNKGRRHIDLLCSVFAGGSGVALVDARDRQFDPHDSGLELAENEEACGGGLQPGLEDSALIPFEIPVRAEVVGVRAWNPDGDDPDYDGDSLFFFLP